MECLWWRRESEAALLGDEPASVLCILAFTRGVVLTPIPTCPHARTHTETQKQTEDQFPKHALNHVVPLLHRPLLWVSILATVPCTCITNHGRILNQPKKTAQSNPSTTYPPR